MGVGMLALPSAMADAGAVGGVGLLLLSAAIATFGSHLLAECVEAVGRPATMSKVTRSAMAPLRAKLASPPLRYPGDCACQAQGLQGAHPISPGLSQMGS